MGRDGGSRGGIWGDSLKDSAWTLEFTGASENPRVLSLRLPKTVILGV